MPRPPIDVDRFRVEIERRILVEKQWHEDIVKWLEKQGCTITQQTLLRRCRDWGASRRPTVSSNDPVLIAAILEQFSTTFDNGITISSALNARGIHTSPTQVNEIRHKHGLHRRARDEADMAEARHGPYGRLFWSTTIIVPAKGDVREALKVLNPEAITAREAEFKASPTNDRIVDFAFSKINEALLGPSGAVGATDSRPEAREEVRTILHNLIQFGEAQKSIGYGVKAK